MSERKVVNRSIAISLGIICIVLVSGLVGVFAYYMPMISDRDNTISSLNLKISESSTNNTNLQDQINQLQAWLDGNETLLNQTQDSNTNLQNQNTNLIDRVNDLASTLNFEKSVVWVNNQSISQQAGNYTDFSYQINSFAGYVSVNVTSSTTDKTYVEVTYSGHVLPGIYYDNTRTVGTNGTADFPFAVEPVLVSPFMIPLPTIIEIRVGNTNTVGNATETVTITYHY